MSWSLKEGSEETQVPTPPPPPKPAPAKPQAAPAPAGSVQVTAPAQAAKPKTKPPAVKAPESAPAPAPKVPSTTPVVVAGVDVTPVQITVEVTGFRLFINCLPMGGNYVDLASVLAEEGAELANEKGAESFYALDSFKRRDMLASVISAVVKEKLNGRDVVAIGGSQDLKSYAEALRPLANEVFIGVF